MKRLTTLAAMLAVISLVACSGGGGAGVAPTNGNGSGSNPTPTNSPTTAPAGTSSVTFSINIGSGTSSKSRRAQDLSSNAAFFTIFWDGDTGDAVTAATGTPPAGEIQANVAANVVTFTVPVPIGIHNFTLLAFATDPGCPQAGCAHVTNPASAQTGANGLPGATPNAAKLLNEGTDGPVFVAPAVTTTLTFVLNGVVAALSTAGCPAVSTATVTLTEGTPSNGTTTITACDASGAAVAGTTGLLLDPITTTLTDNVSNQGSLTGKAALKESFELDTTHTTSAALVHNTAADNFVWALFQGSGPSNVGGLTITAVSTPYVVAYNYTAQPDTDASGTAIVNATVTLTASGASAAKINYISNPATLSNVSILVVPQLNNPPGSAAGSGSACILNPGQNAYAANIGYNNTTIYRNQSEALTADNDNPSGDGLNTFKYTAGAGNIQGFGELVNATLTTNPPDTNGTNYIYLAGQHFNEIALTWQSSANTYATGAAFSYTLAGTTIGNATTQSLSECTGSGSFSGS